MKARVLGMEHVTMGVYLAHYVFENCQKLHMPSEEDINYFYNYVNMQNITRLVEEKKLELYGVFEAGVLVGVSAMQTSGQIMFISVHPACQRRGIGKALMKAMMEKASREMTVEALTLNATPNWMANFFSRFGFEPIFTGYGLTPANFIPMRKHNKKEVYFPNKKLSWKIWVPLVVGTLLLATIICVIFLIFYTK